MTDFDCDVLINGKSVQKVHVDQNNIFTFNRYSELPNASLRDGDNTVEVVIDGKGALYTSGYMKYLTRKVDITPAGNEVFVERKYYIQDDRNEYRRDFF